MHRADLHPIKRCEVCHRPFVAYSRRQVVCSYGCRCVRNAEQRRERAGQVRIAHRWGIRQAAKQVLSNA